MLDCLASLDPEEYKGFIRPFLEARVTRLERDRELLVESIEKLTCRLEAVAANLSDTENTACKNNQHQRFFDQGGSPSLYDADHVESTLANAVDPFPVNVASTTCLQTRAEVNLDVPEHLLKYDTMLFTEGTLPFVLSTGDPRKTVISERATVLGRSSV